MMNLVVCDDEPTILYEILEHVKKIMDNINLPVQYIVTDRPDELLHILQCNTIDILLLDIDMPKISGMDIAKQLWEEDAETLLIFITNKEALVYESFQYHPFGFIRKSCYQSELEHVVTSAVDKIQKRADHFIFKNGTEMIRLKLSDILFFEADSNYVKLYAVNEIYRYRETLQGIEEKLVDQGFIRIHKGFLVNQQAIHAIRRDEVELSNGERLPIGRANREVVKSQLMRYMR